MQTGLFTLTVEYWASYFFLQHCFSALYKKYLYYNILINYILNALLFLKIFVIYTCNANISLHYKNSNNI